MHVDPSQTTPDAPVGVAKVGQSCQFAADLIPIGCPQPPVRVRTLCIASQYVGWVQSAMLATAILLNNFGQGFVLIKQKSLQRKTK